MKAEQIYAFADEVAAEALGTKPGSIKDTSSFAGLQIELEKSADNREAVYNSIIDKVGKTAIFAREYVRDGRATEVDAMEFGIIYERIRYTFGDSIANPAWGSEAFDPFNIPNSVTASAMYFKAIATFSQPAVIEDRRLMTAFRNVQSFGAFVDGIYTTLMNAINFKTDEVQSTAINTAYAGTLQYGTDLQKRNLLTEYNTITNKTLTVASCRRDEDFLKFCAQEITRVTRKLKGLKTIYNPKGMQNQTTEENMIIEVLADFATDITYNMRSNVYHEELVKMPKYREVEKWQYSGTDDSFENNSTISISNTGDTSVVSEGDSVPISVTQSGVIACIRDSAMVVQTIKDFYSASEYNKMTRKTNVLYSAELGYLIDMTQNCVVFYIAET